VLSSIVRLLRVASLVICLIVIASFAIFAVDETKGASAHQQEELNGPAATNTNAGTPGSRGSSSPHEGSVHKAIDEASAELTSPFSGITSGSSSQWVIRGVNLLLALIVYGFGLGYLARVLRVRV
jgi:hypothetical protein